MLREALVAEITGRVEEAHMTAIVEISGTTLILTLFNDQYEYDIRGYGEMVALDGVLMIPDADLIAQRILMTRHDSKIEEDN